MNRIRTFLPLFSLCVAVYHATPARAQVPRTLPAAAHHAWGNLAPTGQTGVFRDQLWFDAGQLPVGTVIRALSLRLPARSSGAYTASLSITLVNTPVGFLGLSPTLDQNLGGASPSFQGSISVPASGPAPTPDQPVQWHALTTPFTFTGPNLLIDLHYTNLSFSTPIRVDAVIANPPAVHLTEAVGCGGQIAASYASGSYTVRTTSALPARQPVTLLLGTENAALGAAPLPMSLSAFGLPGCELRVAPAVVVPAATGSEGGVALSFPFPLPPSSLVVSAQLVHPDTSGALRTTNAVHSNFTSGVPFGQLISSNGVTVSAQVPSTVPVVLLR